MSHTPAAWYPDPEQPTRKRYWDGTQWTGYLVDADKPDVVRYEHPAWLPPISASQAKARGINVPLSVALSLGV